MRMDKLTSKFQSALADAQSLALGKDHQFIEPVHLMLALLDQDGGSIKPLLSQIGVIVPTLRSELTQELARLATVSGAGGDIQICNGLGRLLNLTDKLAHKRGDQFISSELFLLAAVEDSGEVGRLLRTHKATPAGIASAIVGAFEGGFKTKIVIHQIPHVPLVEQTNFWWIRQ